MRQLKVLLLAAAWWSLTFASAAKDATEDDVVDVASAAQETTEDAFVAAQQAQTYEKDDATDQLLDGRDATADDQMPPDYSQQAMQQATYQQPAYDPGQVYYQPQMQPQPGAVDRFLASSASYEQPPVQGPAPQQQQMQQTSSASQQPVQGLPQQPVQGLPEQPVQGLSNPVQGIVPQSPVQVGVASGPQGPELTVTVKPLDGSGDAAAGAGSHVQHGAKAQTTFSLCDILPPPWNIICYILEFIFLTWPMYYFWLGLIALFILLQIYNAFKETLDPIIIAILDAIYLVVWVIVRVCQFIWMCIKMTVFPIKEAIFRCYDAVDFKMNPWKRRTPHTHVPGFSY